MKMLDKAAEIALEGNPEKNYLFGIVALRKDNVYVYSKNSLVQTPSPDGHAEARVLKKAGHGATLWVARVLRDGAWAMAKPCQICETLIKNRKVVKVYYTIGPGEYGVWEPE